MPDKRNIFISFSYDENNLWKDDVVRVLKTKELAVDYSEKTDYSGYSDEFIWNELLPRIKGSSITLVLYSDDLSYLGNKCEPSYSFGSSGWVYREISASLRDWNNNSINGMVLLVKDEDYDAITHQKYCSNCPEGHTLYNNQYLPKIILKNRFNVKQQYKNSSCAWDKLEDSYITIVKWSDFKRNPSKYIDNAYDKRERQRKNSEFEIIYDLHN